MDSSKFMPNTLKNPLTPCSFSGTRKISVIIIELQAWDVKKRSVPKSISNSHLTVLHLALKVKLWLIYQVHIIISITIKDLKET
ncbi:hypothetical protein Hanom_Chr07g00585901 [Helianthus anomalus]